jgi:hypothetical protein
MTLWSFFYRGVTSDALSNVGVFIFRDYAQRLLIFVVVAKVASLFLDNARAREDSKIQPGWQQAT